MGDIHSGRTAPKHQTGQTKPGLNFEQIGRLTIPRPYEEIEQAFSELIKKRQDVLAQQREASEYTNNLFASLQQSAFQGELDLSRVVLDSSDQSLPAHEPATPISEVPQPKAVSLFLKASEATEVVLNELDGSVSKGELISWSADYFKYRIVGAQSAPFSFGDVMQKAESIFSEPPYEETKDIILELLGQGESGAFLYQRFDLHFDEESKAVSGRRAIVLTPAL